MDISVGVVAVGDTSHREVADLTDELRDAVGRLRGISAVEPVETSAPGGAKGVGQVLGAFLVSLPAGMVPAIFEVLKAIVSRPSQPPVLIELTAGSSKVSFDPRQISPKDLATLVEALKPKAAGV
jgi:hypothetical protein